MTTESTKIRDLPPTAVRLAPGVRHALAREAAINGRSLHGEIVHRLIASLDQASGKAPKTGEPRATYVPELTDSERALLTIFRKMSPEKQLALLSLFK